jgi:hypothetical protein
MKLLFHNQRYLIPVHPDIVGIGPGVGFRGVGVAPDWGIAVSELRLQMCESEFASPDLCKTKRL